MSLTNGIKQHKGVSGFNHATFYVGHEIMDRYHIQPFTFIVSIENYTWNSIWGGGWGYHV